MRQNVLAVRSFDHGLLISKPTFASEGCAVSVFDEEARNEYDSDCIGSSVHVSGSESFAFDAKADGDRTRPLSLIG
jgi:hypothetical protein